MILVEIEQYVLYPLYKLKFQNITPEQAIRDERKATAKETDVILGIQPGEAPEQTPFEKAKNK